MLDASLTLCYNMLMKYYFSLRIPADPKDPKERPQYYFADNLFGLLWTITSHRFWHWCNERVWKD